MIFIIMIHDSHHDDHHQQQQGVNAVGGVIPDVNQMAPGPKLPKLPIISIWMWVKMEDLGDHRC